ncbi:unnamed protein product [Rhizoctonia solani]|uniref:Uncharacterized protein n=1 Tax=Rhizoctonia solani TaxID=456999 RepID=A0A8H3E962_9AGAM|nr:unnamed protein product [Rhizoctonia solani]
MSIGVQAGAIYVDRAAHNYIEAVFRRAEVPSNNVEMYCKNGIRDFEAHAKRGFRNQENGQINIGNTTITITSAAVRRGRLTVPSVSMKSFFDVCITRILASVDEQVRGVLVSVSIHILQAMNFCLSADSEITLIYETSSGGGTKLKAAESRLWIALDQRKIAIVIAKGSTQFKSFLSSKAVADGTIIWSYSQAVVSRRPRSTFGLVCNTLRDLRNHEHVGREFSIGVDGREQVHGLWATIAAKVTIMKL